MSRLTLAGLLLLLCAPRTVTADGSFLERFALAEDREQVLKELIPGTQEYYYFHCLHYQNTRQFDRVDELLGRWIARHKETALVQEILHRQALLTFERDPQKTLNFIRTRCDLKFNHQRNTPDAQPKLADTLDQNVISRERLTRSAMQRHRNLAGFEHSALRWLIERQLDADRLRNLLGRLQRPDYPKLPELVVRDLRYRNSKGFGGHSIHGQLLLQQLEQCARLMPELRNSARFVSTWLTRLRPGNDINMRHSTAEYDAWLTRMWDFVKELPPVHNSLKAHVLHQRLHFDRQHGRYNKSAFLTYIRIPRKAGYMDRKYMEREESRRYPANLGSNFVAATGLPPVGSDEPLVRDYLLHLLKDAKDAGQFEPYLDDTWLKHVFAETKIVNGVGDPEQWYSLMPPDKYRALRDRIDLDFGPANSDYFAADAPVALDLHIKNVPTLIVKVFEINAANYYRDLNREVNTDINLDGLVASREETIEYDDPPLRRVKRHFEFPELNKRGTWVVDFIGNGRSSRALIRKGRLDFTAATTPGGQALTVLDESGGVVRKATVRLGGQVYSAGEDGRVVIPFSTKPGRQSIVLSDGEFVSLRTLNHAAESYQLQCGILVDRQALLKGARARVLLRPQLLLNGAPISLEAMRDVRLTINSRDLDGIESTTSVADFQIFEDREASHEFSVPNRLASIGFSLTGKVRVVSKATDADVAVSRTFTVNGIDKTHHIEDAHLTQIGDDWFLDLLGRTGEAAPHRAVQLQLKHRDFTAPVSVTLRSNESGRIGLGRLNGIGQLTAKLPSDRSRTWTLRTSDHSWSQVVHGRVGQPVKLPVMWSREVLNRGSLSVLELRGNSFVTDRFESARIRDGRVELRDLPAGDYSVRLSGSDGIRRDLLVRLTNGPVKNDYTIGESRYLQSTDTDPLQIASVQSDDGKLRIQLAGSGPFARVHVFGNTFLPEISHFGELGAVSGPGLSLRTHTRARSNFVQGRRIGDEYRYILDRRNADRFPGNMNARPEVLLNSWPVRSTQTGQQQAKSGDEFAPSAAPATAAESDSKAAGGKGAEQAAGSNLDFLSEAAAVLINLEPDDKGIVTVDLDELAGQQLIQVVAVDPLNTAWRTHSLPVEQTNDSVDLRLARTLDTDQDYSQQQRVSVMPEAGDFEVADFRSSRVVTYGSLERVYQLFLTLNNDQNLRRFRFILEWPETELERKRTLYSENACHELNFFLYHKDRDFFDSVVRPHLANKLHKTFLDHWLLEADVQHYLQPWHHQRLNAVEQILLGHRIDGELDATRQFIRDAVAMLPPDAAQDQRLFATALSSGALESNAWGYQGIERLSDVELSLIPGEAVAGKRFDRARRSLGVVELKEESRESLEKLRVLNDRFTEEKKRARGRVAYDSFFARPEIRQQAQQLFRQVDKTREWAENNYYNLPLEKQGPQLVVVNDFWRDFVQHEPGSAFLSAHAADATRNFTEMMLALAVLDLPFSAKEPDQKVAENRLTITTSGPAIIVHEEIKPAAAAEGEPSVLVSQNFFKRDDRYRTENNQRVDKFVTEEFLIDTVYGCQVVVTNPTSTPRKLDILLQIPAGSVPVLGARYTNSAPVALKPYDTKTVEYHFYFPAAGRFAHYPAHVARDEKLVAETTAFKFNVVEKPTRIDRESWAYVSQYASSDGVLEFLRERNLQRVDLARIAWRMADPDFFDQAIEVIAGRHAWDATLWSYAVKHNRPAAIGEYLRHRDDFVQKCGLAVKSPLLTIDPVERRTWEHLEYKPLVNARAHRLGAERKILNDRFRDQYARLMKVLSYRPTLNDQDLLSVSYYLVLQDRTREALNFFARVNADALPSRLQHDYFAAYMDFYTDGLDVAKRAVARYADYPVDRWRNLFVAMGTQINEIESGRPAESADPEDRNQTITQLASNDCTFEVAVESREVQLDYENLETVRINYYLMDIELLFSRNPFVQGYSGHFSHIKPNMTQSVDLPDDQSRISFELPAELHNHNVLVEVVGRGKTHTATYYSNSLALTLSDNYGQLRVTGADKGDALPGVYVKAYARMQDGSVKFYKDGYTDLRGRFDYASLSTNQLDQVKRFALLILSDEHGAIVREVGPPAR